MDLALNVAVGRRKKTVENEGRLPVIKRIIGSNLPIRPHDFLRRGPIRTHQRSAAAVCPHDGTLDSLILPEAKADAMFLDKAGWHRAKNLSIPSNMKLKWLPPYSPQCNPTEHDWDELREKCFANHILHSMDDVEDALVETLLKMENDLQSIRNLTGFD